MNKYIRHIPTELVYAVQINKEGKITSAFGGIVDEERTQARIDPYDFPLDDWDDLYWVEDNIADFEDCAPLA